MNRKGFTLIELVIVMAVLSILLSAVSYVVVFATNFYAAERDESISQENVRLLAIDFEKDVRRFVSDTSLYSTSTSGGVTSFNLGDTSSSDYSVYIFTTSIKQVERIYFRSDSSSVSIIFKNIENFTAVLNTVSNPYIQLSIIPVEDNRATNNDIHTNIYLRLINSGNQGG